MIFPYSLLSTKEILILQVIMCPRTMYGLLRTPQEASRDPRVGVFLTGLDSDQGFL